MRQEYLHEAELRLLSFFARRTGRAIHGDHAELAEIALHVAAFRIEFIAAEADLDRIRFELRIDADARVTLLFGVMKMAVITIGREEFRRHVGGLCLQLLHADKMGILLGHPLEKALSGGGADAV